MKRIGLVLFAMFTALFAGAQNDTAYIYTYGGIQDDICNQVIPTWDGGYMLVGTTNSFGAGNTDFYVIKTDSLCNHKWSKTFGGQLNDEGYSVAATPDHGFAFLGFTDSYGNGGYDVFLVKTDSVGNIKWQKTYGGSDWDFGYSIKETPLDSGFIICGTTYSYGNGNGDMYVIKTDKNGDTLWTRVIGGTGYDAGNCVYVQEDSLFVIAGETTSNVIGDTDSYFVELNNKGTIETTRTYGINKNDAMYSIRGTSDHGYVMYGYTDSIPDSATALNRNETMFKTDSTGKLQWMQIYYNNVVIGTGRDAIECPDSSFLTVGTTYGGGFGVYQLHIQSAQKGGWWREGLFFQGTGDEQGFSLAYHNKYNLAFAGTTTYGAGLLDVYLVRFRYDSLQLSYVLSKHYYTDTLGPAGVYGINAPKVDVRLFPNPMVSSATILIQGAYGQQYYVSLFDEEGRALETKIPMHKDMHDQSVLYINKNSISPGNYIYSIIDGNDNAVASGKLIVE